MTMPAAPTKPRDAGIWIKDFIDGLALGDPILWDRLEQAGARPWQELWSSLNTRVNLLALLFGQADGDRARRWADTWAEADPDQDRVHGLEVAEFAIYQTAPDDSEEVLTSVAALAASQDHPWAWPLAVELLTQHAPETANGLLWAALVTEMERVYAPFNDRASSLPRITVPPSALALQGTLASQTWSDHPGWTASPPPFIPGQGAGGWDTRWERIQAHLPPGELAFVPPKDPSAKPLPAADPFFDSTAWKGVSRNSDDAWRDPRTLPHALDLGMRPTDLLVVNKQTSGHHQPLGWYVRTHRDAPPTWRALLDERFPDIRDWLTPEIRAHWMGNLMGNWGTHGPDHEQPPAAIGAFVWEHLQATEAQPAAAWWTQCIVPALHDYHRSLENRDTKQDWAQELAAAEHARHRQALGNWLALSFQQRWLDLTQIAPDTQEQALDLLATLDHPGTAVGVEPLWGQPGVLERFTQAHALRVLAAAPPAIQRDPQVQASLEAAPAMGEAASSDWQAARRYLQLQGRPAPAPSTTRLRRRS